jgi:hypothetical protein
MEYIIAVGLTLLLSLAIIKVSTRKSMEGLGKIKYSQSTIFENTRHFMPKNLEEETKIISQAMQHVERHMIKVIIVDDKAYWVKDNIFYTAETDRGSIIHETVQPVDTTNMSKQDVDKMLTILDNLGKGKNRDDSSSTGN